MFLSRPLERIVDSMPGHPVPSTVGFRIGASVAPGPGDWIYFFGWMLQVWMLQVFLPSLVSSTMGCWLSPSQPLYERRQAQQHEDALSAAEDRFSPPKWATAGILSRCDACGQC